MPTRGDRLRSAGLLAVVAALDLAFVLAVLRPYRPGEPTLLGAGPYVLALLMTFFLPLLLFLAVLPLVRRPVNGRAGVRETAPT